ncbi:efflux RND transporter periplasmic adaptor subunit, partial [Phenylobacterium sp.]|uniref:efflux RND transporter periplasmic adaptor subunit n=1 Tax=Phenylobacterium sp. TaxID=1871053 RepID=UPI00286C209A
AGRGGAAADRRGAGAFGGPAQVSSTSIFTHAFTDQLEVLGVAKGRQSVTLTAATTQLVDKVRFTDGQSVRSGAVLVELRNSEQDAGLAQAQAALVEADRAFQRYRTLNQQGWASKAQLDQFEAAWRSAQANVTAAKARQNDRMIRAPFAGVVGLSDVAPGALVNPGAPIVTLDDVSTIRVDFQVPERYLAQLRQGQAITATVDAYPGATIHGRVAMLDSRIDERTRAITARAEFPNPLHKLKPGMMVRVGLAQGQRQSLAAQESAVSVQGDSAFVYVLHSMDQRTVAEQRPVVTGLRQDGLVEIIDGVKAGDRIVADGLNKIQPGQPVRVVGQRRPGVPPGSQGAGRPAVAGARPGA